VRQYYLRAAPELGDLQVNLVDHHQRSRKSHEIADLGSRRRRSDRSSAPAATPRLSKCRRGRQCSRRSSPKSTAPITVARGRLPRKYVKVLDATPDLVAIDDSVNAGGQRSVLRVLQNKAALLDVAQSDIVDVLRMSLAGEDVTPTAQHRFEIRDSYSSDPARRTEEHARYPAQVARPRPRRWRLVPVSELVELHEEGREQPIYHKNLLPVVYVVADMGGKLDSPLYGMFAARSEISGRALDGVEHGAGTLDEWFIKQPAAPDASYSLKWDGEWQVTYEVFRDMGIAFGGGAWCSSTLFMVALVRELSRPRWSSSRPIPFSMVGESCRRTAVMGSLFHRHFHDRLHRRWPASWCATPSSW
jgi:multidrug efflux pump subunit AcrB